MWPREYIKCKISNTKRRINKSIRKAVESTLRGGMFTLITAALIWIAIFIYVVFYYSYIPAATYTRPIHLQFESCEYNKRCTPFLSSHVRLTKKNQLLMVGQAYRLAVNLEMPESPVNNKLGLFMVCIRLADKHGFTVSHSCRTNMLHYTSDLLKTISLLLFSPLYILAGKEEKQTVSFELYSEFVEDQKHPTTDVYIEVQTRNIELYSATFHVNARLSGLRYIMYHWPLTSGIIGIAFNISILFFISSLSFYHRYTIQAVPKNAIKAVRRTLSGEGRDEPNIGDEDYWQQLIAEMEFKQESSFSLPPAQGLEFQVD